MHALLNKFQDFNTEVPRINEDGDLYLGSIWTGPFGTDRLYLWFDGKFLFGTIHNESGAVRIVSTARPHLTLRLWDAITQAEVNYLKFTQKGDW